MAKPVKHYGAWRIRWIDSEGCRCSEVHPSYAEAERALRRHQAEADDIRAGLRKKAPLRKTFSELCDYWLENRAPQKRSFKDDESIIRAHLRPAFGAVELGKLGVADVDAFVKNHAHLDKKTINNHLTLLISMLNCSVDLRVADAHPADPEATSAVIQPGLSLPAKHERDHTIPYRGTR